MKKRVIKAYYEKGKCEYLSDIEEFKKGLPINCLINKGTTGCGGTTIAITNNKNTIIAMPYVNVMPCFAPIGC